MPFGLPNFMSIDPNNIPGRVMAGKAYNWTKTNWRAIHGAGMDWASMNLGFQRTVSQAGKASYKFLGGAGFARSARSLGMGAGVGAMVYSATNNPLLGIGAGIGTSALVGNIGGAMRLLGPAFVGYEMYHGFKEGGLTGGLWAGARSVGEAYLLGAGLKAISRSFAGTALGSGLSTLSSVALPIGAAAGLLYGTYKAGKYFSARGRKAMETEFVGDMAAFSTQSAVTMRGRALQEIQRSHTNARTLLGNEAQLFHIS